MSTWGDRGGRGPLDETRGADDPAAAREGGLAATRAGEEAEAEAAGATGARRGVRADPVGPVGPVGPVDSGETLDGSAAGWRSAGGEDSVSSDRFIASRVPLGETLDGASRGPRAPVAALGETLDGSLRGGGGGRGVAETRAGSGWTPAPGRSDPLGETMDGAGRTQGHGLDETLEGGLASTLDGGDRRLLSGGGSLSGSLGGSLGGSRAALLDRVGSPSTSAASSAGDPREIGRYMVIARLGAGGMGVVYRAYDPDLDRRVAIKVLRGHSTADARTRLVREAQAMAKLSHPNVVQVFDVGVVGDQVFVAMDYVDGQDLGAWIEEGAHPWEEVVDVLVQAGAGLAAAHAVGLVHRDFKPDNVLLERDPVSGRQRARVADFGLARLGEAEGEGEGAGAAAVDVRSSVLQAELTRVGAVMGTPAYMSPEQHMGVAVDARTDVFSFSVAFFEALYGQRPYGGDSLEALRLAASSKRRAPPPAGTRVPGWLHKIVAKGMSAARDERYARMDQLLAAIEAGRARGRRRGWIAGAAAVAVVAGGWLGLREAAPPLCAGGPERVAAAWGAAEREAVERAFAATERPFAADAWSRAAARLDDYGAAWAGAYGEACAATRIRGELSEAVMDLRMACLDRRLQELAGLVDMFERADAKIVEKAVDAAADLPDLAACADVEALLGGPAPPAAAIREEAAGLAGRLAQARALQRAGKDKDALARLGPLAEEASALGEPRLTVEVGLALGEAQADTGAHEEGMRTLRAALWGAIGGRDDAAALVALRQMIHVTGFQLARREDAQVWVELARALVSRRGDRPRELGALLGASAAVEIAAARYPEAEALAAEAVRLAEAGGDAEVFALIDRLNALGAARVRGGRYAEAAEPLERAVALAEEVRGPNHPTLAMPLSTLGLVMERQGRYPEGIAALRRCLQILVAANGPDHPNVGLLRQNLGGFLFLSGDVVAAGPELDASVRILEASLGAEHPVLAAVRTLRGDFELVRGDVDAASREYERALAIRLAALGPEHPDLGLTLLGLGRVALRRGDRAAASGHLEHALKNMAPTTPDPGDFGQVQVTLAEALWEDDPARALGLARAGLADLEKAGPPVAKERAAAAAWLAAHAEGREAGARGDTTGR